MANIVMNCDLAVIGAGGSGLVAAVKAKHLGVKDVIILEAAKKSGGSIWFAGWSGSGYTKWHKEAGYTDTTDDTFRQRIKSLNWDIDYKLIRNWAENEGPMFDWFDELCDVSDFFKKPKPYVKPAAGRPGDPQDMGGIMDGGFRRDFINKKSRDLSIGPGNGGSYLVTRMREQCEKMGIQILAETRAKEFIKDAKGNVTALLADVKDGKLQVNFKACIAAAGGFGANIDKLKKRWPEFFDFDNDDHSIHFFSCPTSNGDCIDMAEKIGALVDYKKMNMEFGGPVHHPYSFTIFKVAQFPDVPCVNLNGERFWNETDLAWIAHYTLGKQPKGECYAIMDDDMVEGATTRFIKSDPLEAMPFDDNGLRKDIEYEVALDESGAAGNHTKKADTFEELAKKMKIDPKTFVATMNRYNEYCDKGRDLDFYKQPENLKALRKPPFYAFWMQNFANTTHNGIVINGNMEMVNAGSKKAIPNLFAAGDNAQAMDGGTRWATASGYMAGIAAAKYIKA